MLVYIVLVFALALCSGGLGRVGYVVALRILFGGSWLLRWRLWVWCAVLIWVAAYCLVDLGNARFVCVVFAGVSCLGCLLVLIRLVLLWVCGFGGFGCGDFVVFCVWVLVGAGSLVLGGVVVGLLVFGLRFRLCVVWIYVFRRRLR